VALLPGGIDALFQGGIDALFQGGIIERATAPQDVLELALLLGCRPQFLLVGRAARSFCRLLAHA
jgi:hypothetical protein